MPKAKYEKIYQIIKERIESNEYEYQQLLPSENTFVTEFNSSRNTIRRALVSLANEGYVQSLQGKGVRVIYQPHRTSQYSLSGIESLYESTQRNQTIYSTKVILFVKLIVDEKIHKRTSFPIGEEIYYMQRVRFLENVPLIIDHNYFLTKVVSHLTPEIAEESIYNYLENTLDIHITTAKRIVTVEAITQIDEAYLKLDGLNCVAVVSNYTYNDDGVMFEFTQSRHSPKHFEFHQFAQRTRPYLV